MLIDSLLVTLILLFLRIQRAPLSSCNHRRAPRALPASCGEASRASSFLKRALLFKSFRRASRLCRIRGGRIITKASTDNRNTSLNKAILKSLMFQFNDCLIDAPRRALIPITIIPPIPIMKLNNQRPIKALSAINYYEEGH